MSDPHPTAPEIPNADWGPLAGLPGNPIMWMLIASELLAFGAIFIAFSIMRLQEPALFADAQNHLNRLAGALNTMVLLTSGFCAALAVHYQKHGNTNMTRMALVGSSLLGVVFLAVKWMEYAQKAAEGINTETNTFYMFYYLTTGFHAMHVVFGIVILMIVAWKNTDENVITGTAFWHMVDLIWIILFPLIYLVR
jgi:nitric oxide reductase NorE protein